jgi:hypothetical protein
MDYAYGYLTLGILAKKRYFYKVCEQKRPRAEALGLIKEELPAGLDDARD